MAARYAESRGPVVIIALGHTIMSIGIGAAHSTLTVAAVTGCVLAVLVALGMWWSYFDHLAAMAERGIQSLPGSRRAAVATIGTYLHLGVVAGILRVSLGLRGAIEHFEGDHFLGLFQAVAMSSGLALFLLLATTL